MKRVVLLVALAMILGGCSNGFAKFYSGMTLNDLQATSWYVPDDFPLVVQLPDKPSDEVINEMYARGYWPIGSASWEGPGDNGDKEAAAQAKKIGAAYVMWRADYSHTRTGSMPVTTYNPGGTSTTYHTGNVYSGGAVGSYSGTSTTYNPGTTSTSYVPYSVNRYDYTAVFFAKFKPGVLGVKADQPDAEYMRKFDTRAGLKVIAVLTNWRAFKANIFPGDVIMSVNGMPYYWNQKFSGWKFNAENTLQIYRDGNVIEKKYLLKASNPHEENNTDHFSDVSCCSSPIALSCIRHRSYKL